VFRPFRQQFRTVAEADGAAKYEDKSRASYEFRRDARLRDAGLEVVHFTWKDITSDADAVASSIRRAFERGRSRRDPWPA
jgi:very-short-patch-repair endonuclease